MKNRRPFRICARIPGGNRALQQPSLVWFGEIWSLCYLLANLRGCGIRGFPESWRLEPCQRFASIGRFPTKWNVYFQIKSNFTCFLRQASRCSPSEIKTRTLYWFSESWARLSSWKSIIAVVAWTIPWACLYNANLTLYVLVVVLNCRQRASSPRSSVEDRLWGSHPIGHHFCWTISWFAAYLKDHS